MLNQNNLHIIKLERIGVQKEDKSIEVLIKNSEYYLVMQRGFKIS